MLSGKCRAHFIWLESRRLTRKIENDAFVGSPTIITTRMVEENDVVVAEGQVRAKRKDGSVLNAVFCDVFAMTNARIRRLTTYLAEVK
jgi:ketosteroid isomerase-like protein